MNISSLDLSETSIQFLHNQGFKTLYPPQADCIKTGLLEDNNLIVSTPTASGKTLVAIISALRHIENEGKIIYLSPLRALASEKYNDFKKLESLSKPDGSSIKVSISTGDFESNSEYLKNSDIIILTNEKFDSLQRHGIKWLSQVSLVVIDEIHLIGDSYRGPTLEMIIAKMLISEHSPQILGLSATINNIEEISEWIGAKPVVSNWRPVALSEGVFCFGQLNFRDGPLIDIENSGEGTAIDIAIDMVKQNGQSIIFAPTRKSASSFAKKIGKMMPLLLTQEQSRELSELSQLLDKKDDKNTDMKKLLVELIKHGVAFHHAGVGNVPRQIIESGFRDRKIKIICATPTLAAGVNLPARRVVLSSYFRYDMQYGEMRPISVLDYKQMCGRAGRPQYDDKGETILIADDESQQAQLFANYIDGTVEDIESDLLAEKEIAGKKHLMHLYTHVLATISSSPFGISKPDLLKLFNNTLYTLHNGNDDLELKVEDSLEFLEDENFIEKRNNKFRSTRFGKQTSLLYIHPLTARDFRDAIKSSQKDTNYTMGILQVIVSSPDFGRLFSFRKSSDESPYYSFIHKYQSQFFDIGHSDSEHRSTFRILAALNSWINEKKENDILNLVGIDPGDLYFATENTKRLLNAFYKLTVLLQTRHLLDSISLLQLRIEKGIKSELKEIISLDRVGRVLGRALFDSGFKTRESLYISSIDDISKTPHPLITTSFAKKIKEQLKDFESDDSDIR